MFSRIVHSDFYLLLTQLFCRNLYKNVEFLLYLKLRKISSTSTQTTIITIHFFGKRPFKITQARIDTNDKRLAYGIFHPQTKKKYEAATI